MPNAELAYRVLDHIENHPDEWEQGSWLRQTRCGTSACFAGWASLLSGDKPEWAPTEGLADCFKGADFTDVVTPAGIPDASAGVRDRAVRLLDLDDVAADYLFSASNDLKDLRQYVRRFFGPRPS